jgi:predicted Zn-dependent peptidase
MEYQYYTLNNGIRLIHHKVQSPVAHCGVVIDTGSRDEPENQKGIAHFIEHLIFKGTARRKAFHILSRMENVGGDLNAYTAKEETFVYASFLHNHYARALELFADILFGSTFPEKEISKEKDVVLDEINSYKDSPSELIFDEFEELLFQGHPIGSSILGSPESVNGFTRADVKHFISENYLTDRLVISSVGNIAFGKFVQLAEKFFGHVETARGVAGRKKFSGYVPQNLVETKSNYQVHCILGTPAYSVENSKKTALAMLNNILGGPGMNSRLNMGIREKYGYCYAIESHFQPYSDTGNFHIYLGTDNGYLEKSLRLVYKMLKTMREKKMGTLQLHRAKQQIAGQLAISLESNVNEMTSIGRNHLFFEKVDTYKQIFEKVERLDAEDLLEVANEIFVPEQFSMLTYLPRSNGDA